MAVPGFTNISAAIGVLAPNGASINSASIPILISKWQSLIYEGIGIKEVDKFTESAYPFEANILIAYLVIRDNLITSISDSVSASAGSNSQGAIKKIVTGPTEVERFSPTQSYYEMSKNGGVLKDFQLLICALSSKLGIYIEGCKTLSGFQILSILKGSDYSYEHRFIKSPPYTPKPS